MASYASRYAQAFADVLFETHLNAQDVQRQLADFGAAWVPAILIWRMKKK